MKYVAFLRAINVGGNAILRMADLKKMFEAAGLENVQTYIQSGNVIFESDKDMDSLTKQIERRLENAAKYKIHVFVRTMQQVQSIVKKAPFTAEEGQTVFVAFLKKKPDKKRQEAALALKSGADELDFKDHQLYNLRRDRENSVFSSTWVEKILKMPTTTRNLTTLAKIVEKFK